MPDEAAVQALRTEVGALLEKGGDPNSPEIIAKYEKLYGKAPADMGAGLSAGPPPTDDRADRDYFHQSVAESDRVLRAELGDQFESTIQAAREYAASAVMEAFQGDQTRAEQALDSIMNGILAAGGSALEINRLLISLMGKGGSDHEAPASG